MKRAPKRPRRRPSASSFAGLALPKGKRPLPSVTRRADRKAAIAHARAEVWARSFGRCELCGDTEAETRQKAVGIPSDHQLHEALISRAEGRRLPAPVLFNAWNCMRVCPLCHDALTANRRFVSPLNWSEGVNGSTVGIAVAIPLAERIRLARLWSEAHPPPT